MAVSGLLILLLFVGLTFLALLVVLVVVLENRKDRPPTGLEADYEEQPRRRLQ